MQTYDFISKRITEAQVKSIITKAGYNAADCKYTPRVDGDGFLTKGDVTMSLTTLRNAAKALKINVEISSSLARETAPGSPYEVNITMSLATVQALTNGGYSLYGFKAVASSGQKAGAPLVWFSLPGQDLLTTTSVRWEEDYQAYISNTLSLNPLTQIVASADVDISLGQQWDVQEGGGTDVVDGLPLAISILNTTDTPYTCGISQLQQGVYNPLCGFPLYGGGLDVMVPIEKVVLTFSTLQVNTGTVIEQAYTSSIFIDLTSENTRNVNFDINQQWSWGGGSWAQQIPAGTSFNPFLIEPPSSKLAASLLTGAKQSEDSAPLKLAA
ncbi:MAG TPA: hypothetical protein VLJ61_08830 [Pyrinomonadaceae bacterium]|nr:hypothetical protein [Pyrinomonadaceae bacterium]